MIFILNLKIIFSNNINNPNIIFQTVNRNENNYTVLFLISNYNHSNLDDYSVEVAYYDKKNKLIKKKKEILRNTLDEKLDTFSIYLNLKEVPEVYSLILNKE
jgi:hypothetical protein